MKSYYLNVGLSSSRVKVNSDVFDSIIDQLSDRFLITKEDFLITDPCVNNPAEDLYTYYYINTYSGEKFNFGVIAQ